MKEYSSILKLIALVLSFIAVICLLAANIEAIMETLDGLCGKAKGKLCRSCAWSDEDEDWDDEYEDWDD